MNLTQGLMRLWLTKRLLTFALLIVIFSAARLSLAAQEAKLSPEKQAQIESAISRFMATTHASGVSAALVENGQYEWAAGFGMADLENNVPAGKQTLYRLASISKSLTAT